MSSEGEAKMSFQDAEQSDMMLVVGVLLAAVGAAMVMKWSTKALACGAMKVMRVMSHSLHKPPPPR